MHLMRSELAFALSAPMFEVGEPHDGGVLAPPVAIVVRNEPHGLDRETGVDDWVPVSMPGRTESLNVAMAAGTRQLFEPSERGLVDRQ